MTPPPPHPPEGVGVDQIFAVLRRRLRLIVAIVAVVTALAAIIGKSLTPAYTATASLVIESTDSAFEQLLQNRAAEGSIADRLGTEIELIRSRSHLERVMRDLNLFEHPDFRPPTEEAFDIDLPEPLHTVASWLPGEWLVLVGVAEATAPAEEPELTPGDIQAAIDRFRKQLAVEQSPEAQVINLSFSASSPDDAARIANGLAEAYVDSQVEYKRQMARGAVDWLEERLDELQREVEDAEQRKAEFQAKAGLTARPDGSTPNQQRLVDLTNRLDQVRSDKIDAENRLSRARALSGTRDGAFELAALADLPALASLPTEEQALERELAELGETLGPRHPQMVSTQAELADVRRTVQLLMNSAVRKIEDELRALERREQTILQNLEQVAEEVDVDQQEAVRQGELERQAAASSRLYEMFLENHKEAQERVATVVPDARIISLAQPPRFPSTPGTMVFALVGFTVSLMFGPMIAFLMDRLDRRVHNAEGIEQSFGLPVLGLLPRLEESWMREQPGFYITERPFSSFAEAGRSIVTSLRLPDDAHSNIVMVTSALPGEGKTTLSITLAASAVRSGYKTLLVDLDLRRPSIEQRLGAEAPLAGLADHLNGQLPRSALIRHDATTGIDFVSVGRPPTNPIELMQSPGLRHLFEVWQRDYDQIIIDTAPALAVTDTKVAARLADSIVLAVRWRSTDIDAVRHAMRTLMQSGSPIAGCVLTSVNMNKYRLYASGEAGAYYKRYRNYYLE